MRSIHTCGFGMGSPSAFLPSAVTDEAAEAVSLSSSSSESWMYISGGRYWPWPGAVPLRKSFLNIFVERLPGKGLPENFSSSQLTPPLGAYRGALAERGMLFVALEPLALHVYYRTIVCSSGADATEAGPCSNLPRECDDHAAKAAISNPLYPARAHIDQLKAGRKSCSTSLWHPTTTTNLLTFARTKLRFPRMRE